RIRRDVSGLRERKRHANARADARFALDRIATTQAFDTLLHAAHAESRNLARMDSAAVVAHCQRKPPPGLGAQRDGDVLRLRVADGVGEAFLKAAIDGEIDRVAIAAFNIRGAEAK